MLNKLTAQRTSARHSAAFREVHPPLLNVLPCGSLAMLLVFHPGLQRGQTRSQTHVW